MCMIAENKHREAENIFAGDSWQYSISDYRLHPNQLKPPDAM